MKRAWFELLGALMNEDVDMTVNTIGAYRKPRIEQEF